MKKFFMDRRYFDVYQTLECGQTFRYVKNAPNDYFVCSRDKRCRVYAAGDKVAVETAHPDYFFRYFDGDNDYGAITEKLMQFDELRAQVQYGKGIRILNQDPYEMTVSFIISANNNIPRIKSIIERLCTQYGEDMGCWKAFPSEEKLLSLRKEDFRANGCGFRDAYLEASLKIISLPGYFKKLAESDTQTATGELLKLKGVGKKVADCITLFGLKKCDAYPVDTWIFKANKSEILNTPEKVRAYYLERYGNLAGYAQQYLFFYNREMSGVGGNYVAD